VNKCYHDTGQALCGRFRTRRYAVRDPNYCLALIPQASVRYRLKAGAQTKLQPWPRKENITSLSKRTVISVTAVARFGYSLRRYRDCVALPPRQLWVRYERSGSV
jgi:hypothetical protein